MATRRGYGERFRGRFCRPLGSIGKLRHSRHVKDGSLGGRRVKQSNLKTTDVRAERGGTPPGTGAESREGDAPGDGGGERGGHPRGRGLRAGGGDAPGDGGESRANTWPGLLHAERRSGLEIGRWVVGRGGEVGVRDPADLDRVGPGWLRGRERAGEEGHAVRAGADRLAR